LAPPELTRNELGHPQAQDRAADGRFPSGKRPRLRRGLGAASRSPEAGVPTNSGPTPHAPRPRFAAGALTCCYVAPNRTRSQRLGDPQITPLPFGAACTFVQAARRQPLLPWHSYPPAGGCLHPSSDGTLKQRMKLVDGTRRSTGRLRRRGIMPARRKIAVAAMPHASGMGDTGHTRRGSHLCRAVSSLLYTNPDSPVWKGTS
jgi:hypothetical protein